MEALAGISIGFVIIAVVVGLILFFAPIIIIMQLSKIINLLDKIGYSEEMHHQEIMNSLRGNTEEEPEQNDDDRAKKIMQSLFQDDKNTPD